MILLITYDLKRPGQNYQNLYEAIKLLGGWWHYLESTWLVETNNTPNQVWERLHSHVDQNDRLFIVQITRNYQGWLTQDAWDWINQKSF